MPQGKQTERQAAKKRVAAERTRDPDTSDASFAAGEPRQPDGTQQPSKQQKTAGYRVPEGAGAMSLIKGQHDGGSMTPEARALRESFVAQQLAADASARGLCNDILVPEGGGQHPKICLYPHEKHAIELHVLVPVATGDAGVFQFVVPQRECTAGKAPWGHTLSHAENRDCLKLALLGGSGPDGSVCDAHPAIVEAFDVVNPKWNAHTKRFDLGTGKKSESRGDSPDRKTGPERREACWVHIAGMSEEQLGHYIARTILGQTGSVRVQEACGRRPVCWFGKNVIDFVEAGAATSGIDMETGQWIVATPENLKMKADILAKNKKKGNANIESLVDAMNALKPGDKVEIYAPVSSYTGEHASACAASGTIVIPEPAAMPKLGNGQRQSLHSWLVGGSNYRTDHVPRGKLSDIFVDSLLKLHGQTPTQTTVVRDTTKFEHISTNTGVAKLNARVYKYFFQKGLSHSQKASRSLSPWSPITVRINGKTV